MFEQVRQFIERRELKTEPAKAKGAAPSDMTKKKANHGKRCNYSLAQSKGHQRKIERKKSKHSMTPNMGMKQNTKNSQKALNTA